MTSVEVVIANLERSPDLILPLVREVPQAILKRRPKPGNGRPMNMPATWPPSIP